MIAGGLFASLVPVGAARALQIAREPLIGEGYGAEVATHIPPGAVLMTQGDGFLFTLWYEAHVRGRGVDFATLDMGNLRTPWYQRYLRTHDPAGCDPRSPAFALDPASFASKCGSFEQRMALGAKEPWVSLGLAGNRRPYPGGPSRAPVLRNADPECADKAWHDAHVTKECRCWRYGEEKGSLEGLLEEDCAESAEEHGVVARDPLEIFAQRVIEDSLDERPVFERNTLTSWSGPADNLRGWTGPSYQRVSARYALVNRGRFNQVVWWDDIRGFDPCAGAAYRPMPTRAFVPPTGKPRGQEGRRPYRPNDRPTLLAASYLTAAPTGRDDDATRTFAPGDAVYWHADWFEKFAFDATKPDHRGAPVRHGLRLCLRDPRGQRLAVRDAISGSPDPVLLLDGGAARPEGTYHLQACTVGEVGEASPPLREGLACRWIVLEYDFDVRAGGP